MTTLTRPAFANCHSHVFHRALRGREAAGQDFWAWRNEMYAVAEVLDPELMYELALGVYGEMRLAGIAAVGEFHYLHHPSEGTRYDDPNAMGEALIAAARDVGMKICLLDTCYLAAGFNEQPNGVQHRFSDGNVENWAERIQSMNARYDHESDVVIGSAIHSVRAVPVDALAVVANALPQAPLHVHVSEQQRENDDCLAATSMSPVELLAEAGVWSKHATAVHATHLSDRDIAILGDANVFVCFAPTTEAELADGIGPSVALREAGARITLGSDSQTVIDGFIEARSLAMHERLGSGQRDSWNTEQLWRAASTDGHESLGFADVGTITVRGDSVRTAGSTEPLWSATAADVLSDLDPDEVAHTLQTAIAKIWERM